MALRGPCVYFDSWQSRPVTQNLGTGMACCSGPVVPRDSETPETHLGMLGMRGIGQACNTGTKYGFGACKADS